MGVGNAAEMDAEPIKNTGLAKVTRRLHVAIAPIPKLIFEPSQMSLDGAKLANSLRHSDMYTFSGR